jgi:hypothetical protein
MVTDTPTAMVGTTRLTPIHLTGMVMAGDRDPTLGDPALGAMSTPGPRRGRGDIPSGTHTLGVIATVGRQGTTGIIIITRSSARIIVGDAPRF